MVELQCELQYQTRSVMKAVCYCQNCSIFVQKMGETAVLVHVTL